MYHTRSSNIVDKENEEAASSRAHTILTRQQSSSLIAQTPTKQQLQQTTQQPPLKSATTAAIPGTPSHGIKQAATTAASTPTGHSILRAKTNQQLPATLSAQSSKNNNNSKKSALARTFSAATSSTNDENAKENSTAEDQRPQVVLPSPDIAALAAPDARRKSMTRRGSNIRERLIVHRDESLTPATATSSPAPSSSSLVPIPLNNKNRKKSLIRREAVTERATENATTTLAMERSQTSTDKVIVGESRTESKRRALSKPEDDDDVEIEYCPPRQEEQPYECEVQIDKRVFDLHPPAFAYYVNGIDDFDDLPPPSFEPAETRRKPRLVVTEEEGATSRDIHRKEDPDNNHSSSKERVEAEEESELEATLHPEGSPTTTSFGIVDLHDASKTRPPFDGFVFDVDDSGDDLTVAEIKRKTPLTRPRPLQAASVKHDAKPVNKVTKPVVAVKNQQQPRVATTTIGVAKAKTSTFSKKSAATKSVSERKRAPPPTVAKAISTSSVSASTSTSAPVPVSKASSTTLSLSTDASDNTLLKDIGLEDLEDSSKVDTSFSDFQFDV